MNRFRASKIDKDELEIILIGFFGQNYTNVSLICGHPFRFQNSKLLSTTLSLTWTVDESTVFVTLTVIPTSDREADLHATSLQIGQFLVVL